MPKKKRQPGLEYKMHPRPKARRPLSERIYKLEGKIAIITGGDSGIGRAAAVLFAQEGADVAIIYLNEHKDAHETCRLVTAEGRRCIKIAGDVGDEQFCKKAVEQTVEQLGKLDILINNAAEQHPQSKLEDITQEQL